MHSSPFTGCELQNAYSTSKVLHEGARSYLGPFVCISDLPAWWALRSAGSILLVVPPVKLSIVGSQAFSVTIPQLWNSLPDNIILVNLLSTFRHQLKHHLFQQSYPDVAL